MKNFFDNLLGINEFTRGSSKFQARVGWFVIFIATGLTIFGSINGVISENNIVEIILSYLGYSATLFGVNMYRVTSENKAKILADAGIPVSTEGEIEKASPLVTVTTNTEVK